jgi:predicted Fe-S protein YdhL (DUF1289 family)
MTDALAGEPVASPCVRICALDEAGLCRGCGRLIAEIAAWPSADEATRRAILARAATRRPPHTEPNP